MKTLLALILISSSAIAACGSASDASKAPSATSGASQVAAPAQAAASVKPAVAASAPAAAVTPTSYYLDSAADLPACDAGAQGWLVYLKDPGEFQACEDGAWTVVDIQGPAGAAGAVGAAGPSGAKGSDGIDAAPGLGAQWTDPDTGHVWMFTQTSTTYVGAGNSCTGGFTLPQTQAPAKLLAYFSEFLATLPNTAMFWAAYPTVTPGTYELFGLGGTSGSAATGTALTYQVALCFKY
jgi:hypothetical protein